MSKLRLLAEQIPDFARLEKKWNGEHVSRYVTALCYSDNAADTIARLESEDLRGLACAYHERVEMDEMEKLFDKHAAQEASFRKLMDSGRLNENHLWFDIKEDKLSRIPYLMAHEVALEKEVEFIHEIAKREGHNSSLAAVVLTHPQLEEKGFSVSQDSKPSPEELKVALDFWQNHKKAFAD